MKLMQTAEVSTPPSIGFSPENSFSNFITTPVSEITLLTPSVEADVQPVPIINLDTSNSASQIDVLSVQDHPEIHKGVFGRTHDTAKLLIGAVRQDWQESDNKLKNAASLGEYIMVKAFGRYQLAAMYVSYPSMVVYGVTRSVILTAATATGTSGTWSMVATNVMNKAVNNYPRTFKAAGQLSISRNVNESLPGLRSCKADRPKSSLRERAFTDFALGVTATVKLLPYIAAAGREGHTPDERRRLARKLYIGAGVAKGVAFGGIAETISLISHSQPHLANNLEGAIRNPLSWTALGGALMVREFVKNKYTKHRTARKSTQDTGAEIRLNKKSSNCTE